MLVVCLTHERKERKMHINHSRDRNRDNEAKIIVKVENKTNNIERQKRDLVRKSELMYDFSFFILFYIIPNYFQGTSRFADYVVWFIFVPHYFFSTPE